eukprot:4559679-Pyramimonas_sp.AAC.1
MGSARKDSRLGLLARSGHACAPRPKQRGFADYPDKIADHSVGVYARRQGRRQQRGILLRGWA